MLEPVYVGRFNRHYYRVGDVWQVERAVRRREASVKPPASLEAPDVLP